MSQLKWRAIKTAVNTCTDSQNREIPEKVWNTLRIKYHTTTAWPLEQLFILTPKTLEIPEKVWNSVSDKYNTLTG